ncbi:MAG: DUF5808 domain-containing protein [Propionibacteriaceae bacterium]|jgi:uncharacterized membrane protein|nr:DUF5808 domain-containing protein [Propionibacteriaceae bacterium]
MLFGIMLTMDVLIIGALAFIPYITRRTQLFGVSVPPDQADDPELARLKGRYRNIMLALGVVVIAATAAFAVGADPTDPLPVWVAVGLALGYAAAAFAVYLPFHRRVKAIKAAEGWTHASAPAVVTASTEPAAADMVSPAWLLAFPLLIGLGLLADWLVWPQVPDTVPTHFGADGVADAYSPKGFGVIAPLLLTQVFLAVVFVGVYFLIRHARRQTDAANPVESLEKDRRFRRLNSIAMILLGCAVLVVLETMQLTTMTGSMGLLPTLAPALVLLLLAAATMWVMMFHVGQGGSRLRSRRDDATDAVNYDDDRFWKLGLFYFNPDDPALFVERRFGVGWTANFARPLTWIVFGVFFALVIGLIVASAAMAGS